MCVKRVLSSQAFQQVSQFYYFVNNGVTGGNSRMIRAEHKPKEHGAKRKRTRKRKET
jgi:hypothetical protein